MIPSSDSSCSFEYPMEFKIFLSILRLCEKSLLENLNNPTVSSEIFSLYLGVNFTTTESTSGLGIKWDLDTSENSLFYMYLYGDGDSYSTQAWTALDEQPIGETMAYVDPGVYYFEFSVSSVGYQISVDVYIP